MSAEPVILYHNPRCSKSRQTLQLLQENGVTPQIIKYLETPPSQEAIKQLLVLLGLSARELMRKKEHEYKENQLNDENLSEQELIAAISRIPKLMERPIVIANGKARIGRPPEQVLDIL